MSKKSKKMSKKSKKKLSAAEKELYHEASKYLDLKALFRSKSAKMAEITPYKIKKIKNHYDQLVKYAGGLTFLKRDFIPHKSKNLGVYNAAIGAPHALRGVILSGGSKLNTNIRIYKDATIKHDYGARSVTSIPLDCFSEDTITRGIAAQKKRIEATEYTYLTVGGSKIIPATVKRGETPVELMAEKALYYYTKYKDMYDHNMANPDDLIRRVNGRLPALMRDWGVALTWDFNNNMVG